MEYPKEINAKTSDSINVSDIESMKNWISENKKQTEEELENAGALLFRGFPMSTPEDFHEFINAFGYEYTTYVGGGGPRNQILGPIHTSTESPPNFRIVFHHELAYLSTYPSKLFFFCQTEPAADGETPICLSHKVVNEIRKKYPHVIENIKSKGVMYERILCDKDSGSPDLEFQKSWQSIFETEDKKVAEKRANETGHETVEWLDDGSKMKIRTGRMEGIKNYKNGEIWFNSIILLHPEVLGMPFKGWHTTFGDGSEFDVTELKDIKEIMENQKVSFQWKAGDVLLIDNFLSMHSRNPFTPPRKVLVAMAK